MASYMPNLIEKLKEDVLKLKSVCKSLKDNSAGDSQHPSTTASNNQQELENEETVNKWITEKKLLVVKTDLVS